MHHRAGRGIGSWEGDKATSYGARARHEPASEYCVLARVWWLQGYVAKLLLLARLRAMRQHPNNARLRAYGGSMVMFPDSYYGLCLLIIL